MSMYGRFSGILTSFSESMYEFCGYQVEDRSFMVGAVLLCEGCLLLRQQDLASNDTPLILPSLILGSRLVAVRRQAIPALSTGIQCFSCIRIALPYR